MLRITVLGTGYVGLVSGVCLADIGHHVTCIDKNLGKIQGLKEGIIPIYEEGLEEITKKNMVVRRLSFSSDLNDSLNESDIVMIAVGTPNADKDTGAVNLKYIESCVDEIATSLTKNIVVIVKSTVPVGTCDWIQNKLNEKSKFECSVVSNPEFLREGTAVYDFMNPDRIIFGSDVFNIRHCEEQRSAAIHLTGATKEGGLPRFARNDGYNNCVCNDEAVMEVLGKLYSKFAEGGTKIIYTDCRTSELIKYASNGFLAMKVGFINEMADVCEKVGADVKKLSEGIGSDKRIGPKFLNPGPGFGGSCFPKDVMALCNLAIETKVDGMLVKSILKSNSNRFEKISNEIMESVQEGSIIAILGLAFKAGTDDVRDSPSIEIIERILRDRRYKIKAYDPAGIKTAKEILGDKIEYYSDIYEACVDASLVVVATEWDMFKELDATKLKKMTKDPNIYDLRCVIDKEYFLKNNFKVKSIGYKENVSQLCPS
jgi:UDPglucose 6-dehydrogenase